MRRRTFLGGVAVGLWAGPAGAQDQGPVWRRVDMVEFSVEMPTPIRPGPNPTLDSRWFSSRLGPIEFGAGEFPTAKEADHIIDLMIKTVTKSRPGSVAGRETKRLGEGVVRTDVAVEHADGGITRARYLYAPMKPLGGKLIWQAASDDAGRAQGADVERFFSSLRSVPTGAPAKKR